MIRMAQHFRSRMRCALWAGVCLLVLSAWAGGQDTQPRRISARQIDKAAARGVKFLYDHVGRAGQLDSSAFGYRQGGAEALAAWAVLSAGRGPGDAKLATMLNALETQSMDSVFARSARVLVFAGLGPSHASNLREDTAWLIGRQNADGGWGGQEGVGPSNVSDTAMAILAMDRAAQAGADVPEVVWKGAESYLERVQNADGGFGHQGPDVRPLRLRGRSHGSSTAAAAAVWGVLIDRRRMDKGGPSPSSQTAGLARTEEWLWRNMDLAAVPQWHWGDAPLYAYRFFLSAAAPVLGAEQVRWEGLSGALAAQVLDDQRSDGSWRGQTLAEDDIVSTAWAVLTLCQARRNLQAVRGAPMEISPPPQPRVLLVIGRLGTEEKAQTCARATEQLSRDLSAAVNVGLKQEEVFAGQDYNPGLTMVWLTGRRLKGFGAPATAAMKAYLDRGGLFLADSAIGGEEFFQQVKALLEGLYGQGALQELPADSPLCTGNFAGGVGSDISRVGFSPAAARILGRREGPPQLWAVIRKGRVKAIVSRYAIALPAAGATKEGCVGYAPEDARRIALNVLLYAYTARQGALE